MSTKAIIRTSSSKGSSYPPPPTPRGPMTPQQEKHETWKNQLVHDVLGEGAGGNVPMEKVVMLIWQFRDDPTVVTFMARFISKYAGVRHVLDGIEFYLPQLAHMIIHLEVEWDDAILERFALVIAQQSIHFALQLNWILQGALQDYRPENDDGTPNDSYHKVFYTRCLKLLKNLESCVVFGKPRAQELQRLYESGQISKPEMELLEQADRRFNALQITTEEPEETVLGELDGWHDVQLDDEKYEQRYCLLDRNVLHLYVKPTSCASSLKLVRALALEQAVVTDTGDWLLKVQRPNYTVCLKFHNQEELNLWMRRLREEALTSGLFNRPDIRKDLTPAQLDRYDFFQNERVFVRDLTDIAEKLRNVGRVERKRLAPDYVEKLDIPNTVYSPLCNSSDIWRRVSRTVSKETRVFNTKERCPMIIFFISKRGERFRKRQLDPNLDVAEFLHLYFDVGPAEPMLEEIQEENDDQIKASEHSGVWTEEETTNAVPSRESSWGNIKVQRLLRESFVTIPSKLAKRLGKKHHHHRRSFMDRQTQMQPMVQILEGRSEDGDSASVGDGTVVSVERSSVLVKDRILYGSDLDEKGKIDLQSIDRAKKFVSHGESWAEKSAKMLEEARKEESTNNFQLEISTVMAKSYDDLRQEVFVMQMIHFYKSVFAQAKLPLWLKTYRILSTSSSTGLLEVLMDATSLDGLKKSDGYPAQGGLRKYFEIVYGGPDSAAFKEAQRNFMQSLAAYGLVSYLLGLKDRHNGNIMIDTRGHLIFIDFGFALGMAPGHEFSMERAPFKLTREFMEVMGGVGSDCYKEFERLFVEGFEACRKNSQIALGLVEIMMFQSNYPCFSGWRYGKGRALVKFEKRLMLSTPDRRIKRKALKLIRRSQQHGGTYLYDVFQKKTNGYAI